MADNLYKSLTCATVEEFQRLVELFPNWNLSNGDLKTFQRPWAVSKIQELVPKGSKVVDIGGSACEVADALSKLGYEVWVVDPYDGRGGGTTQLDIFKKRYPKIHFIQDIFHENLDISDSFFDATVSVSVLEHISADSQKILWAEMKRKIKNGGFAIDAIDFTFRGKVLVNIELIDVILSLQRKNASKMLIHSIFRPMDITAGGKTASTHNTHVDR